MRWNTAGEIVSTRFSQSRSRNETSSHKPRADERMLDNYRAIQTALLVILQSTKDFEIDGPLEYARMPELGIISCPVRFVV